MVTDTTDRPLLRVVRGAPSDEELAAVTVVVRAVFAARAQRAKAPKPQVRRAGWDRDRTDHGALGTWTGRPRFDQP